MSSIKGNGSLWKVRLAVMVWGVKEVAGLHLQGGAVPLAQSQGIDGGRVELPLITQ